MLGVKEREGHRPTESQELLLRATLLKGEEALKAWEKWSIAIDIDLLEHSSQRILPLLYRNLITLGVKNPSIERLKGPIVLPGARTNFYLMM